MSNIGSVKTKIKIEPQEITNLLNNLNKMVFRDQFTIEPGTGWSGEGFGWHIYHKHDEMRYGSRFYTMTETYKVNDHCIESEHKGGGDHWIWWVDTQIFNAIAEKFDGKIYDEGCSGEIPVIPGGQSWEDHLKIRWKWCIDEGKKYPAMVKDFTPEAFRKGLDFEIR